MTFLHTPIQNKKAGFERSQGTTCGLPAQVRQKHLHCTGKAYNAGKSPVLKVFKGGLRLLPAACVALKAGPALLRKRKILIISLQSQPAPAGWTHNTETIAQSHAPAMIVCCGCSGKEIYLPTAKIAPSFRNFLTPCVPVANRRVVVPRTTPRVLFTKLGKHCVFDTIKTRRRTGLYLFILT